jgi:hypothetical protein
MPRGRRIPANRNEDTCLQVGSPEGHLNGKCTRPRDDGSYIQNLSHFREILLEQERTRLYAEIVRNIPVGLSAWASKPSRT